MKTIKGSLIKLVTAISILIMLTVSVNMFTGEENTHYSWNPGGANFLQITEGSGALTDTATTTLHKANAYVDSITTGTVNDTSWLFANPTNYPNLWVQYLQNSKYSLYQIVWPTYINYIRFIFCAADSTLHTQMQGIIGYVDLPVDTVGTLTATAKTGTLSRRTGKAALSVFAWRP